VMNRGQWPEACSVPEMAMAVPEESWRNCMTPLSRVLKTTYVPERFHILCIVTAFVISSRSFAGDGLK
jgi:hypothetical protein